MKAGIEEVSGNKFPSKICNAAFLSVFAANMLMYAGIQMTNSLLGKYAYSLGASGTVIGLVTGLFAVTALGGKIFSAPAIDTFNRKYILAGALFVAGLAMFGYSFSKTISFLVFFRLFQGAGQAFTVTCCLALASDALPQDKIGEGLGYFSLAQAVCQAAVPALGLKLADYTGYSFTFALSGLLLFTGAIAALRIKTPFVRTKKFKISPDNIIAREALLPALIMFFLSMGFYNITSFLAVYGEYRGTGSNIGYFFTVYALSMLVSRPLTGKLSDKYGHVKILIPAMFCFVISFFMISYSRTLIMFLAAGFVSAFGYGACFPAVQALCIKMVPRERRGAGSCTNYIGNDVGNLIGPVIAGSVVESFGFEKMWRFMTLPVFLAMVIVFVFRKRITEADP
jgi:MFS family permease